MTNGTMAEALAPLRARMPQQVREQEILRIAAYMPDNTGESIVEVARREVLAWAQRRSGSRLPGGAWNGESFESFAGGRTTIGARLSVDTTDLWALRADDPDRTVPGRIWTTEVTIGQQGKAVPRLSVRLMASTPEDTLEIEPHTPGLVMQIATKCGLSVGGYRVEAEPWRIGSEQDVVRLLEMLEEPERSLPVFVATGDERGGDPDLPLVDADGLARAVNGLAHVVILPARFTYPLTDAFGKTRSVYFGAVRIFMPGFDANSDPYDHRLFLSEPLQTAEGASQCVRQLRLLAARQSLLRFRLNHDVLPFASVRSAVLRLEQERQANEGASESDQLKAAQGRISALEEELEKAKDWEDQLSGLHQEAEDRAVSAEVHVRGATARVQQLLTQLKTRGDTPDAGIALPAGWPDFAEWCDENLVGRLVLAPSARRGVKKPAFEEAALAARCLLWLANECRDRRIDGGGSLTDAAIEDGVRNAPCGSDRFEFEFRGRRLAADWHVKNGGNTRDPSRCLRIYYAWDQQSQQIVVADMPAHRRTGAT